MYIVIPHMEEAGDRVTGFMKSEGRLPNYVSCMCYDTLEVNHNIVYQNVTMPQFLYMTTALFGSNGSVKIRDVNPASAPLDHMVSGQILESEYRSMAQNIKNFIESNGRAPNYANSSLGKIPFDMLIYIYARIYSFMGSFHMPPTHINIGFLQEDDTIEQV